MGDVFTSSLSNLRGRRTTFPKTMPFAERISDRMQRHYSLSQWEIFNLVDTKVHAPQLRFPTTLYIQPCAAGLCQSCEIKVQIQI